MGVALAAVQVFSASTTLAGARHQLEHGLRADQVLTASSGAGVSPAVVDAVRHVPGVAVATPVARMQVLLTFPSEDSTATKVYSAEGIASDRLSETMDLGVIQGNVGEVRDGTVALSRTVAQTVGARVGGTIVLRLGDGTVTKPRVVATYENGLGFGDVTLPNDLVVAHTTARVDNAVLIRATPGTDQKVLGGALRGAVKRYPTVKVGDREAFLVSPGSGDSGDWALNLLFRTVLLGYIAIAVVNTLVMATAARVREFALMRLIGAGQDQVRAMMNGEARIVVFSALLFGLLASIPPLVGTSIALTKSATPSVSLIGFIAIVALTIALSWGAITIATRFAMRSAAGRRDRRARVRRPAGGRNHGSARWHRRNSGGARAFAARPNRVTWVGGFSTLGRWTVTRSRSSSGTAMSPYAVRSSRMSPATAPTPSGRRSAGKAWLVTARRGLVPSSTSPARRAVLSRPPVRRRRCGRRTTR